MFDDNTFGIGLVGFLGRLVGVFARILVRAIWWRWMVGDLFDSPLANQSWRAVTGRVVIVALYITCAVFLLGLTWWGVAWLFGWPVWGPFAAL